MKKLKEKTVKFINWINGKKTYIGVGIHFIWGVVNFFVDETKPFSEIGHSGIFLLTGVGLGHKGLKWLKK